MATQPEALLLQEENARLKKRLERERTIRLEAEAIAEKGLRDLYERQRELQTLERIATNANQTRSIPEVLQFCLEEICNYYGWKTGHGYLTFQTERGIALRPAGVWFAAEAGPFEPFARVTRHSVFHMGEGLPGRALEQAKPIWISDLSESNSFPRLGVGWACGLRSAVSFPVLSGDNVVAVLEFFDTCIRAPSGNVLDLMGQIGTQLGRVIERQNAEDAMRDHAKELTRARDIAEAADRAKSSFLANISHELRTPLNAIIGFSEMMEHEIAGPLNGKYKEYATDIQRSGNHLKKVINDILDLSKIAVGALTLREQQVCLGSVLQACQRIVQPLANNGQVELKNEILPGLPMILADETRLQQAVLNILSNAVKFTPPGGHVDMRAAHSGGFVVVEISDTGIGMTPEDIAVALQPFRQIDGSLARRYEGTGLGLPLAKAFAELHGGTLSVDSKPKEGTTIRIALPASRLVGIAS